MEYNVKGDLHIGASCLSVYRYLNSPHCYGTKLIILHIFSLLINSINSPEVFPRILPDLL